MKSLNTIQGFSARKEIQNVYKSLFRWRILSLIVLLSLLTIDISGRFKLLVPFFLLFPLLNLKNQINIWYNHIKRFGMPLLHHCLKMWQLDARRGYDPNTVTVKQKERGHVLPVAASVLLIAGILYFLWAKTGFVTLLYFAIAFTVMPLKALIRRARPPAVLFLSASSSQSNLMQLKINEAVYPLEVSSCLYHEESAIAPWMAEVLYFKSYRTADDNIWKEMVTSLVELSPIIVLDIQKSTKPLEFEIGLALNTVPHDRLYFISEKPVPNYIPHSRCFSEDGLIKALRLKLGKKAEKQYIRDEADIKIFRDRRNQYFMFTPPTGWMVYEYQDPRTKVKFSHPKASEVYLRFIIRETYGDNYSSMLIANRKMEHQIQAEGLSCKVKEKKFLGVKCIETFSQSNDTGIAMLIRKFIVLGLHFNILYAAPNKILFDKYLDEALQSLDSIVVLKGHNNIKKKAQKQQIANRVRLAELAAEYKSIDEARQMLSEAANEFPDSKLIRDVSKELNLNVKNRQDDNIKDDNRISRLKLHNGSSCTKCKSFYDEKLFKCPRCDGNVVKTAWYSRSFIERYAFIGTLIFISILIALFDNDNEKAIYTYPILTIIGLFFLYRSGNLFMNIGGLTEKFPVNSISSAVINGFSWKRYFYEFLIPLRLALVLFGISLAISLFILTIKLVFVFFAWIF